MTIKNKLTSILLIPFILILASCGTLNPEGAYKGDKILYNADKVIVTANDSFQAIVSWEFENKDIIKQNWPEIASKLKKVTDEIRLNSDIWLETAIKSRDTYEAVKTEENANVLRKSIDVIKNVLKIAVTLTAQTTLTQPSVKTPVD